MNHLLGDLLLAATHVAEAVLSIFTYAIVLRALISWIAPEVQNPKFKQFTNLLTQITQPILSPFQKLIPNFGNFDISPILVIFCLELFRQVLIRQIYDALSSQL